MCPVLIFVTVCEALFGEWQWGQKMVVQGCRCTVLSSCILCVKVTTDLRAFIQRLSELLALSALADANRITVQSTFSVRFLLICSTMMLFSHDCVEVVRNSYVLLLRIADTFLCEEAFTFEARQERIPVI